MEKYKKVIQKKIKWKCELQLKKNKFELSDGWYCASNIQDYFGHFLIEHGENTDNPSIRIFINKLRLK